MECDPPTARTLPSKSNVAVWAARLTLRSPVKVQVPVAGSYSSAVPVVVPPGQPPAASTLPLGSNVCVWSNRASLRLPVKVQVPVAGLYSSALLILGNGKSPADGAPPPATSTLPSESNVAVWYS